MHSNSFDLLRLIAACLVLFSHQHVLLGYSEPAFFGWTTFGGTGVSIFFFLSGALVWSSWSRDPDLFRFFFRRALRIFPALWVAVLLTVLVFGPLLSTLSVTDYFGSNATWRYTRTALLLVQKSLPGVLSDNPYPSVVNGSLWTLPVEFLCYGTVAVIGSLTLAKKNGWVGVFLCLAVLLAAYGWRVLGWHFVSHFEMVAFFWWGVTFGCLSGSSFQAQRTVSVLAAVAFVAFVFLGERGMQRTAMLLFAAMMVLAAQRYKWGAILTARLGDLSYGMYIFAFPVQQMIVEIGRGREWAFAMYLGLSFLITGAMAYLSWHLVEKPALRFKPLSRSSNRPCKQHG